MLTLIRIACRLAFAAACVALFALWIDPHWVAEKRTLELRVRRGPEVLKAARALAERVRRDGDLPEVASGKENGASQSDELTDEDRRLLQRLIEEKLQE